MSACDQSAEAYAWSGVVAAHVCSHYIETFHDEFTAVPTCLTRRVYTFLQTFQKRRCGAGPSDECWLKSGPWRWKNENLDLEKDPCTPPPPSDKRQDWIRTSPSCWLTSYSSFSCYEASDLILTQELDCLHSIILILKLFFLLLHLSADMSSVMTYLICPGGCAPPHPLRLQLCSPCSPSLHLTFAMWADWEPVERTQARPPSQVTADSFEQDR